MNKGLTQGGVEEEDGEGFEWGLVVPLANSSRCCWSAVFITVVCVFFRGSLKNGGDFFFFMENVVTARYVKEFVEEQGKTQKK